MTVCSLPVLAKVSVEPVKPEPRAGHLGPGVTEVLRDAFEPFACPHAACGLADEERVAELAEDDLAGCFGRLAATDAVGGGHGDVGGDLFVDIVCTAAPESHGVL